MVDGISVYDPPACSHNMEYDGHSWLQIYIMRFDDDSIIKSPVTYNIFNQMRKFNLKYGFRSYSLECGDDENGEYDMFVGDWMQDKLSKQLPRLGNKTYCGGLGKTGFYNNFYVTEVKWWRQFKVASFLRAFDRSHLIFTHRIGDLSVQTVCQSVR